MTRLGNLSKLLDWLRKESVSGDSDIYTENFNFGLKYVIDKVESGAFDFSFDNVPKILAIKILKGLREDYLVTENDDAIDKVIDWLINCTQDYME